MAEEARGRGRKVVLTDGYLERDLLVAMITGTVFLKRVARLADARLFASPEAGRIATWVLEYFGRYREAPGDDIRGLFEENRDGMDEGQAALVAEILKSLSEQSKSGAGNNEAYLFDRAVRHFKKRSLEVTAEGVRRLLDAGRLEEAEVLWSGALRAPAVAEDLGIDPFDPEAVMRLREQGSRFGMTLGVAPLDRLAGPQLSEWLIMAMGPMKRGKTQFLTHCSIRAKVLGLNVVYVSLESGYEDNVNRALMSVGSMVNSGDGRVSFPSFNEKGGVRYDVAERPNVRDTGAVMDMLWKFNRMGMGRSKLKSFPSYSAGLVEISRYLDALEAVEGWSPHVVCVDYLGAMKPPKGYTGRDIYDVNSKGLKSLSEERKCIVFSAHQGSRATLEKMNMSATDVPEDVRILGNVDILYGLNQTDEEKAKNIMRMNVLMHRFRGFNRIKQALILQQPEAGQFCLDAVACDAPMPKDMSRPTGDGEE